MRLRQFILGSCIDVTSYAEVCDRIVQQSTTRQSGYVVAANVHVVMTAYWDLSYQAIINHALLVTPDGMPLVWALRLLGWPQATRVYGPDLMLALCDKAAQKQLSIYLYGGTEDMLTALQENLRSQFPTLAIAGTHAPPFRELTSAEAEADLNHIRQSGADMVFVALGCPKQEIWMAQHTESLCIPMMGVGAAFAFHSGVVKQAPRWMMSLGLEWLYRLAVEPRRLWQRYFVNNPAFLILLTWQLCLRYLGR